MAELGAIRDGEEGKGARMGWARVGGMVESGV